MKTRSDKDGRFHLILPMEHGSTWDLNATYKTASAKFDGFRADDGSVVLELPALGRVGIRMLDPITGETVSTNGIYWRVAGTSEWRWPGLVVDDQEGVRWFYVHAGGVDLMANSEDEELQPATVFGVVVDARQPYAWDLVAEPGVRLTVVFRSEQGEEGFPPDGPSQLVSALNLIAFESGRSKPGLVNYRGLGPGTYTWTTHEVFVFEPPNFRVGSEPETHVDVTWRVVDFEALQRLEAQLEHMRHQAYTD